MDESRIEAEMKARRERSDNTTNKMGEMLLQGYCMMSECCNVCQTPLMRARDKTMHCVTCEQDDGNTAAAQSATENVKESMVTTSDDQPNEARQQSVDQSQDAQPHETRQPPADQSHPLLTGMFNPPAQPTAAQVQGVTRSSANSPINNAGKDPQEIAVGLQVRYSCVLAAQAVSVKLQQASQMLSHAQNVNETVELCSVINACVNTIQNIQPLLR